MHLVSYFFSWPNGQVWPNLIASFICSVPAIALTHWRLEKRHKRHVEQINNHYINQFANLTDKETA